MTQKQINWAAQHDWFVRADAEAGTVTVADRYTIGGLACQGDDVTFTEFRALREWAGY